MKTFTLKFNRFHFWLLSLAFLFTFEIKAQTVFVFNQSSGGYDFQNPTTWTNNAVPQNGDILSFAGIGFNSITNVPAISLSELINTGGGILLTNASTGADLQIDNLTMTNDVGFATSTSFNVTVGNALGTGGRFSYSTGVSATITGTFIDKGLDLYGWTSASLTFASGSIYKADYDISNLKYLNWAVGSTISITGITASNQLNSANQVFSNLIFDSPAATSDMYMFDVTCLGTFAIKTIGGKAFNLGDYHLNDLYMNDGRFNIGYTGTLYIAGNVTQTGGSFGYNSSKIALNGTTNQLVGLTNIYNGRLVITNTGPSGNNSISLQSDLLNAHSVSVESGVFSFNGHMLYITNDYDGVFAASGSGSIAGDANAGINWTTYYTNTLMIPAINGGLGTLILSNISGCNGDAKLLADLTVAGLVSVVGNGGCGTSNLNTNGFNLYIGGLAYADHDAGIVTSSPALLQFGPNAVYIHERNGGNIPVASWLTGSAVSVTGITTNGPGNMDQNFYDFIWDSQNQAGEVDLMVNGAITTVNGTMFIKTSGSSTINFSNYQGGLISNNFIQTGGSFGGSFGTVTWINSGNFAVGPLATFTGGHGNMQISLTGSNVDLTTTGTFFNLSSSCVISFNAPNCTDVFKMNSDWNIQANADWNSPTLVLINGVLDLNGYSLRHSGKLGRGNACASMNGGSTSSLYFSNTGGNIDVPKITNGLYNFYAGSDVSATMTQLESLTITGGLSIAGSGSYNVASNTLQLPPYLKGSNIHVAGGSRLITTANSMLVFPENSLYVHDINGGNIPSATWLTGSTASIAGMTGNQPGNTANQNFYNLTWNSPSQSSGVILLNNTTDNLSVAGTLSFIDMGPNNFIKLKNGNGTDVGSVSINNYFQSGGIFRNDQYGGSQGYSSFTIYGNISMTGGLFTLSTNGDYSGGYPLTLAGGNSTIGLTGGTITGVPNIVLQKNAGSSLMLATDVTLNSDLTFQKGNISTGMNTLWVTGTIYGTASNTGWVNGNLAKNIGTGSNVAQLYEVGTSTVYAPVTLTFPTVSTGGLVSASVADGDNPNIGEACINPAKSINKYWSIHTIGGTSLAPFSFDAAFTFDQSADLDAGINLANLKTFVYDGANWNMSGNAAALTATTVSLTSLSAIGDYYFAETGPKVGSITGSSILCMNAPETVYSVTGNSCSTSFTWTITGGTFSGTGNSISVVWTSAGVNQLAVSSSDGTSNSDISTIDVSVTGIPAMPSAISSNASACLGTQESYSVTTIDGLTYNWSVSGLLFPANTGSISVNWTATGSNIISVSATNACFTSPESTLSIMVNDVPAVDAITGQAVVTVSAQNLSYSVTSTAGVAYLWSISGGGALTAPDNTASVVWSVAGTFTLSVAPSNACGTGIASSLDVTVASISGIIVPPLTLPGTTISIAITAGSNTITTDQETLQLTATISPADATVTGINWSVSDTAIAKISASGLVTPVSNGIVTITASVADDASITNTFVITISGQGETGTITGITNNLATVISLYPNPATSAFMIATEFTGTYSVEIYNLQGIAVDKKVITETAIFNTEKLNAGVYLVKVQSGSVSKTFRLVINK